MIVSVVLNLLTITYLVISHHKGDAKAASAASAASGAGKVYKEGLYEIAQAGAP